MELGRGGMWRSEAKREGRVQLGRVRDEIQSILSTGFAFWQF